MRRGRTTSHTARVVVAVCALFAALLAVPLVTAPTAADARPTRTAPRPHQLDTRECLPTGTRRARGTDAVTRLGDKLDEAAARVDMTPAEFRAELVEDRSFAVDRCGNAMYVEAAKPYDAAGVAEESAVADAGGPTTAAIPVSEAFRLQSRPGSLRTILLDFDGQYIPGNTAWAQSENNGVGFSVPGYDTDGNAASFSTTERTTIRSIWQRVAEDYAPFDVNVTTVDPGFEAIDRASSADQRFGTRVVIASGPSVLGASPCDCGGVAYVGVYGSVGAARFQPAFVFASGSGGTAKGIAEATSHEAGHNLGLSHDGNASVGYYEGAGAWAPIMGVGYYRPVSQWSKGEYPGANNTEDDLSLIVANGAPNVTDDHGGTIATARDLGSQLPVGAVGEIGAANDVDMFKVTVADGPLTVSAAPAPVAPNLDISLTVYDASGTVVATADPASTFVSRDVANGLAATSTTAFLAAGTYHVAVDGVGQGSVSSSGYSDYGSLGRYALAVSTTNGPAVATPGLPRTVVGRPYLVDLEAAGGTTPYAWSVIDGALPDGVTLGSDGSLTGTPTSTATATFAVRVTDSGGRTAARQFVVEPGVEITSADPPDADRNTAYTTTLAAAGGTAPYTWTVASGSLPPGLTLSSAGVISGTPTTAGTASSVVRVTDAAGRTSTRVTTMTVGTAVVVNTVTDTGGRLGLAYGRTLTASGGRPYYVWSLASGTLPPGLTLTDTGRVSGTPSAVGTWTASVRATDLVGRASTANVTITVTALPTPPAATALWTGSGVELTWPSAPPTGTTWTVYRSASSDVLGSAVGTVSGRVFTDPGATANTTWQYRAVASNTAGERSLEATPTAVNTAAAATPAAVSGSVTVGGQPQRGAQVRLHRAGAAAPVAVAVVDAAGAWSVTVAPGWYEAEVVPTSSAHARAWLGSGARSTSTLVEVRAATPVASLTFPLASRP